MDPMEELLDELDQLLSVNTWEVYYEQRMAEQDALQSIQHLYQPINDTY